MKKNEIIIYTSEKCPYCKQIKDKLEENKIEFTEKLIEKRKSEWIKVNGFTGMAITPTFYYKNNYFVAGRDFANPQQLVEVLKNFKKSEFNESTQVLEKVKTLSHNINIAFSKLDQLLRKIATKLNTEKDEHKSTS